MGRINKIDYFVGVFLSTILSSSKGIPALFDEGVKDSKRVEFETDSGCFNVYIKYSTNQRTANVRVNGEEKKKVSWDITFSNRDYYILKNQFEKDGRILAYSTIGRSRKRQRKRRGKMSVEKFQKLAEYLLEIIVYKKPPEYEDEVYDGSLLTVRIQFPDKRIGEYIHDLQGTAVWDHIEEAFVGSRIRVLHN